jgi:uncharacterized protein (UPF0276 family)
MQRVQGVGLGLRWEFIDELLERAPALDFLEVSPENYMGRGGYYRSALARALDRYPIVTHGLTMSLGGFDPLGDEYLAGLAAFVRDVRSPWHSDHLCFGSVDARILHDLLPLGFSASTVERVADRVRRAQDAIGVPMAVENISFYMHPGKAEMTEAEFVARVCERAQCGLMLDVNNAYVNAQNFGYDLDEWMRTVPLARVVQMHVAGHELLEQGDERVVVDTHGTDVCDPVLLLLERVLEKTGPVPVLLERDENVPALDDLLVELAKLKTIWTRATRGDGAA